MEHLKRRMETGARDRDRTDTPPFGKAADFKSAVSTNFTTRAAWDAERLLISAAIVSQTTNKKHRGAFFHDHEKTFRHKQLSPPCWVG